MAKKRKIKCDCGELLGEKTTFFGHIETAAMVCPACAFTTLTKEQAQQYMKLKEFHNVIDSERKIIKIGNSIGITLPDRLREFGAKAGSKIKTEALGPSSFKVEFVG